MNKILWQPAHRRDILQQKLDAFCVGVENNVREIARRFHPRVEIALRVIVAADMDTQRPATVQANSFDTLDNQLGFFRCAFLLL